jgi:hypothetical protein
MAERRASPLGAGGPRVHRALRRPCLWEPELGPGQLSLPVVDSLPISGERAVRHGGERVTQRALRCARGLPGPDRSGNEKPRSDHAEARKYSGARVALNEAASCCGAAHVRPAAKPAPGVSGCRARESSCRARRRRRESSSRRQAGFSGPRLGSAEAIDNTIASARTHIARVGGQHQITRSAITRIDPLLNRAPALATFRRKNDLLGLVVAPVASVTDAPPLAGVAAKGGAGLMDGRQPSDVAASA